MKYPFFTNTKENYHCSQATMQMMLAAHHIRLDIPSLNFLLHHKNDESIWVMQKMNVMSSLGFRGKFFFGLDLRKFARYGESYMKKELGSLFRVESKYADWKLLQRETKTMLKDPDIHFTQGAATLRDIQKLFTEGWMVVASMNYYALQGEEGFMGHSVLVTNVSKDAITIHDPGLPAHKNWKLSNKKFLGAFIGGISAFQKKQ